MVLCDPERQPSALGRPQQRNIILQLQAFKFLKFHGRQEFPIFTMGHQKLLQVQKISNLMKSLQSFFCCDENGKVKAHEALDAIDELGFTEQHIKLQIPT
ncbi:hypothetical protein BS78_05G127100 [Paspalum vaginatum]|nr:hypothetical protein BS78_05G127100 [Paspalum vaginatum]